MSAKRARSAKSDSSDKPYRASLSRSAKSQGQAAGRSGLSNPAHSPALTSCKIIVGVDFGTTYTGVSYASSGTSEIRDIAVIGKWPGPARDTDYVMKTPSRIVYPTEFSNFKNNLWGFQVEAGMDGFSWFKLLLDDNTPLAEYDDAALEKATQLGIFCLPDDKEAIDMTADFLSEVYQWTMKVIGKQVTDEALAVTPLEFWFTVPAIWSDRARNATIEAARRAGFTNDPARVHDTLSLISEPEAAALTALKKCSGNGLGARVKPNEGVLICDCGGGTVDITTYLITQQTPKLAFEELCTGTGAKCGSTAVDRRFYQLMSSRFGNVFKSLPMRLKGPGSNFMSAFESVKRNFGPSDHKTVYRLPLNLNMKAKTAVLNPEYFDEAERLVIISRDDLHEIFDPVVNRIRGLVRQQIKDAREVEGRDVIRHILLVGGFGDSEYLYETFQKEFGSKVTITVPDNPQAAIVQGAALRGMQGLQSTTRRCRRHYGYECWRPFREGVDPESVASIHPVTGQKIAEGYMEWIIHKGDKYYENDTRSIPVNVDLADGELQVTSALLASDRKKAPERADSESIYEVGAITSNFDGVGLSQFQSKVHDGRRHYISDGYQLDITFGAHEGILKVQGTCRGAAIGYSKIDYSRPKIYQES